ncbi:uncharacterized protein LOC144444776 [Glandiceps talaboti]
MAEIDLRPSEIRYLHDTIAEHFRNGTGMLDTFKDLLYKDLTPGDIPTIQVFRYENKWYVYSGHRRLYLYKRLQKQRVIDKVTVEEVDDDEINWKKVHEKDTSENDGKSVEVRGDKSFVGRLGQIVKEWKNSQSDSSDSSSEYSDSDYEYSSYVFYESESDSDVDVFGLVNNFGNLVLY